MAILDIVTFPDPSLRIKAKPVRKFDKELQTLIDDMFETMRNEPGVGLAAPQIGQSLQLAVIEYAEEPENEDAPAPKPKRYVLVNPEIVQRSEDMVEAMEGCLSVPGLIGLVDRHEAITVKALTRHGKPQKIKVEGWMARIFQHEMDHLNGVLYIDRASEIYEPVTEEAIESED
ncbi:MAG: peptide deformylase [Chloroflexi bacterium]|jgi:peptide deformylase|nr:peptide deformylase [Chloroflexota bacterium]